MAQTSETLESLLAAIVELTTTLTATLRAKNLPEPSFNEDAPGSLPPDQDIQGPRTKLVGALMDMLHLAMGPNEYFITQNMWLGNEAMALDVLNRFNFWGAVPLGGSASYAEIAAATKLPEQMARRFLRFGMSMYLFREESPESNRIVHTAASAYMARNHHMQSFTSHLLEDVRPATIVMADALQKWSAGHPTPSEEVEHAAFYLASFDGKVVSRPIFAEGLQALGGMINTETYVETFDWESLGEAIVVDVGGSSGHISAMVAKSHPQLHFVVQDLPELQPAFDEAMASAPKLADRISFQVHDFFTPQPVSASAYIFRNIFHDWPDKYVVKILQQLVPALTPGARIALFDIIMLPDYDEKRQRPPLPVRKMQGAFDMQMLVLFNAKERTAEDWTTVFKLADDRFRVNAIKMIPGASVGLIDVVFDG
ncbi:o-methyltransferase domain-containing protein [Trichoderma breve]|uniref:O-methyltransferase domain-containing protein n=1 Tax=Trichoderma breve TaxID=2034170 RepID=A0A9W9B3K3_9HYPO|nr:o-methyltransferase domain-containing protein [Trichoderma breve]KAJ4854759.1 o-methyltransferase domain-containing protein [Trichoderma breve]